MSQVQILRAKPWSREVKVSCQWWRTQLATARSAPPESALDAFETSLAAALDARLQGHWHTDNPIRGQAHRSISLHRTARPDPVLLKAAHAASINKLFDYFNADVLEVTMFIDPCEVAVQITYTYCKTPQETIVWTSPEKLKFRKPISEAAATTLTIKTASPMRTNSFQRRTSGDLKASSRDFTPSPSSSPSYSPSSSPPRTSPIMWHTQQPLLSPYNYVRPGTQQARHHGAHMSAQSASSMPPMVTLPASPYYPASFALGFGISESLVRS